MKNWKTMVFTGVVACTLALPALANADEMMNKISYDYTGVTTMMKDGMELVPLRQVAESLGYQVSWMGETRSITLSKMLMDDKGMMQDKSMMDDKGMMQDKSMMDDKGMMQDKSMMGDKGMMKDKSMMDDKGMMQDKSMMDDKGMMQDKSMMDDKGMMQDKSMADSKGIMLQIDSKTVQIGGMTEMVMYAPVLIDSTTYVTKAFVDMYLLK
ncbi:stalk domain-containing protein [Paenibacillus ferrarius]|uniref:stalk domain-containing protein n=1 Tax=Paenibacillus ferrarius TaxID=1469647 RepID=UPI003D2AC280